MAQNRPKKTFKQKVKALLEYDFKGGANRKYLFESIATMLASGIDLHTIVWELRAEAKKGYVQEILDEMILEVENGTPVWKMIDKFNLVPDHYLSLIRIGEYSGNLPKNLESVVGQVERDKDFQNKLKSASLYPSIVGVLLFVVILVMLVFVLPSIADVYASLNIDLPVITQILIAVGKFLGANVVLVLPIGVLILILLVYLLFFNKTTKRLINRLFFRMPGLGRIIQEVELTRMGYLLSSLLDSGIQLPEALVLMESSSNLPEYSDLYKYMAFYVEKGYTLESILGSYKGIDRVVPLYPKQLIVNGEKSRRLSENLNKIGDIFAKKNEISIKDIGTIFEPALLMVVWVGVATFAVAVILPIYSILGNLNNVSGGGSVTGMEQPVVVNEAVTDNILELAPGSETVNDEN